MESQILYRYEDSRLQNHLIGPTIQDTAVSKYNYSIAVYLYLSKNTIYTCNVKVMGYILNSRAYGDGSVNGNIIILMKTDSPPSFIQIGDPKVVDSPCERKNWVNFTMINYELYGRHYYF